MPAVDLMQLLPEHRRRLEEAFASVENRGTIDRWRHLDTYYANFRARFGPEVLAGLDGFALLERMHIREGQNCLMYWLEFKNDEEFPAIFGNIGGGSALKFGIYQKAADGRWMKLGQVRGGVEISADEAVDFARRQRDQLLAGCERLEQLGDDASDADYLALQDYFDRHLPLVADAAWSHKYFHLIFPTRLDDFHNADYQRFYLIKLLQLPPENNGRFVCGAPYLRLARDFERPVTELTLALQEPFGAPHDYWRIDASKLPAEHALDVMRAEQVAALPWAKTGDISDVPFTRVGRNDLRRRVDERVDLQGVNPLHVTQDIFALALRLKDGDLVIVTEGDRSRAIGRVSGPYEFAAGSPLAHRRPVEWLDLGASVSPDEKGWARALTYYDVAANKIAVEQRLMHPELDVGVIPVVRRLSGLEGRIQSILDRKGQVILYGPPGTGKTYWANRAGEALVAQQLFQKDTKALTRDEHERVGQNIRRCTFHPAYGYEDFLEGYRPEEGSTGGLVFRLRDGIFRQMCADAATHPKEPFVLIIDEINRGDVPRIFGELLTVLEKDKRGQQVVLPLSGELFAAPTNVAVIGTMNTADRSIALLDTALRRRFGFIELMPDTTLFSGVSVDGIPLGPWLEALNAKIVTAMGADGRNLQVGHAYLLESGHPVTTLANLSRIVRDDIVPLLQEYCYEDYRLLEQILGRALVDGTSQLVHVELFREENREDLKLALLAIAPDITTSAQAVAAEAETPAETGDEESAEADEMAVPADDAS